MSATSPANNYTIRQFHEGDVTVYKAIRLEALQTEPGMFGNSHALEASFTEEQWRWRVSNPDGACFGLYFKGKLIGITSIIIDKEQRDEAYMTQSYIRSAHRGKRLSRMLYETRIAWAKARGLRRLLIGHKASNLISKAANQHFHFNYSHSESRTWPDGSTEYMLYYQLLV